MPLDYSTFFWAADPENVLSGPRVRLAFLWRLESESKPGGGLCQGRSSFTNRSTAMLVPSPTLLPKEIAPGSPGEADTRASSASSSALLSSRAATMLSIN